MLGAATVANQLLQFACLPILTRLYGPEPFGVWGVIWSMSALVSNVGGLRYEQAIVVAADDSEALAAARVQTRCNLVTVLCTLLVTLVAGASLAAAFDLEESWPLYLVPGLVLITGVQYSIQYWLTRTKQFKRLARFWLAQPWTTLLSQLGLYLVWGPTPRAFLIGAVAGQLMPCVLLKGQKSLFQAITVGRLRHEASFAQVARKFDEFPKYLMPAFLVDSIRERGLVFLLTLFGSLEIVGAYTVALRLVWAPMLLVSNSMTYVFFQRAATEPNTAALGPVVTGILRKLISLFLPAFIFLTFFGAQATRIALGARWESAGWYISILAPGAFFFLLTGWLYRLFSAVGQQRIFFIVEVFYTVTCLASCLTVLFAFHNVSGALIVVTGTTILFHIALLWQCYRCCDFPLGDLALLFWDLVKIGGPAVGIAACSLPLAPGPRFALCLLALGVYSAYALLGDRIRARRSPPDESSSGREASAVTEAPASEVLG
jgi:O-antigen/teichoic acid export membrane protein